MPVDSTLRATARFVDVREEPQGTFITARLTITADEFIRTRVVPRDLEIMEKDRFQTTCGKPPLNWASVDRRSRRNGAASGST